MPDSTRNQQIENTIICFRVVLGIIVRESQLRFLNERKTMKFAKIRFKLSRLSNIQILARMILNL